MHGTTIEVNRDPRMHGHRFLCHGTKHDGEGQGIPVLEVHHLSDIYGLYGVCTDHYSLWCIVNDDKITFTAIIYPTA